jgi:hypothetical protein
MHYTSDETSRKDFPPKGVNFGTVGRDNPIHESLMKSKEPTDKGLEDHYYEYINRWKVVEIMFGLADAKGEFKSWRNSGVIVNPNVLLYPESLKFDFALDEKYENVMDAIKGKAGFLAKAEEGMELVRLAREATVGNNAGTSPNSGGKFVSRFSALPAWTGGSGLIGPSSFKFNFQFGQAGLFSAEEEVVKPILALASRFAPYTLKGFPNYLKGPMPTVAEYLVKVAVNLASSVTQNISEAAQNALRPPSSPSLPTGEEPPPEPQPTKKEAGAAAVTAFNTAVDKLTKFQQNLLTQIDASIQSVMNEEGQDMSVFWIQCGQMSIGPFYSKKTKWDFDFTNVDERGYPTAGSITLDGIETYMVADRSTVLNIFKMGNIDTSYTDKVPKVFMVNK